MLLSAFLSGLLQFSIIAAFCILICGGAICALRFLWEAAPRWAEWRFRPSSSSPGSIECGPPMPDGLNWDIINSAPRAEDGRIVRKDLCARAGRAQGGLWYSGLKSFLDYHNL